MRFEFRYRYVYLAYLLAAIAVGACFLVNRLVREWRLSQEPEDLTAEYAAWGIDPSVVKHFVPLPMQVPCDLNAAKLGGDLFQSRKLGVRACAKCHPLNAGGVDGMLHGGAFTRPAVNAVFGKVFLHDGSIRDFPALVKRMIEGKEFGGAESLESALARLGEDGRNRRRFTDLWGENGFAATNIVNALVNYERTLMTPNGPFDRFCGGRDALSPERMSGFDEFQSRRCASCHYGPSLGSRAVTENGVKVPSLRGLNRRSVFQAEGKIYTDLAAAVALMPGSDFGEDEKGRLSLLAFLRCL